MKVNPQQTVRINRAQALAIADTLKSAPDSAVFVLEQTITNTGGTHLYLHDRTLSDPCVHIAASGNVSPRLIVGELNDAFGDR